MSDSFGIICKAKVNRIISRNNPRTLERHFAISSNTDVRCLSFLCFTKSYGFRKGGQRNGAQAKTVTDLEQRVIERKKKYVRYQEGAELYSMGVNSFREVARDAKAMVRIDSFLFVIPVVYMFVELVISGMYDTWLVRVSFVIAEVLSVIVSVVYKKKVNTKKVVSMN